MQPGLHLWIGDVMDIGKGRHTTTDVSLHPLNFGGYIVDTPEEAIAEGHRIDVTTGL